MSKWRRRTNNNNNNGGGVEVSFVFLEKLNASLVMNQNANTIRGRGIVYSVKRLFNDIII